MKKSKNTMAHISVGLGVGLLVAGFTPLIFNKKPERSGILAGVGIVLLLFGGLNSINTETIENK